MDTTSGAARVFRHADRNTTTSAANRSSNLRETFGLELDPVVERAFNSTLGLYLPLIDELRVDRAEHAIFEAALNSVGQPLGQELLTLRLWNFVTHMSRDATAVALKDPETNADRMTELQQSVFAWGRRHVVEADRATQIGVAILIGGTNVLDQGELYDLPDELAELLTEAKQAERHELRRRHSTLILRHSDLRASAAIIAKRQAAE